MNDVNTIIYTSLSPIVELLKKENVTDVMINADGSIWIDDGNGVELARKAGWIDADRLRSIASYIAGYLQKIINDASPTISGSLPFLSNCRVQIEVAPVVNAPVFSFRKPSQKILTLDELEADDVINAKQKNTLSEAVIEKKNILIAGGTGSGKTTLTKSLLALIPKDERIIIIEDTPELFLPHQNGIRFLTTPEMSAQRLLRSSLRHRPDRILLGEVRGGEALDLLKAWNTGHPGGIATIHADSADSALDRCKDLVEEVVANCSPHLLSAVDIIVYIVRKKQRRIVSAVHLYQ